MPANVGEMFYFGEVPWHGRGKRLEEPADMETAIRAGGLDWEVETVPLVTDEDPPSPAPMRLPMVRSDRKPGTRGRVLGIAHRDFKPLQNRQGLAAFDAIDFPLTTVRVVCQNTLSLALNRDTRTVFKHAHQGDYSRLKDQVKDFFDSTLVAADALARSYRDMLARRFDDDEIKAYVEGLFPLPVERPADQATPRAKQLYAKRVHKAKAIQETVYRLGAKGLGTGIKGVRGSLWGTFNAVLEYVDHHADVRSDVLVYSLFGAGAVINRKGYEMAVGYLK